MDPIGLVADVVGRVRQEIILARFVGKFAVDGAVRELRRRLDDQLTPEAPSVVDRDDEPAPADVVVAGTIDATTVPSVDELALPDYDVLPATHVIAALDDLEPDERDAIARYEESGRHRRTILVRIAQLRDEPAS